ncbi:MAG: SRPBCC family protein [Chitinophagales bacterium]
MAQKEIKTAIQISASPKRVWEVFTNFEDYGNWNPFILSIEGNVKMGERIKINAGGMRFKPEVLAFEENKELRWKGKFLFEGIFDGEHIFLIEDNKDGTVTFKQEEKFSGILVGLFAKKLDTETKEGFKQMNRKLKELAENKE